MLAVTIAGLLGGCKALPTRDASLQAPSLQEARQRYEAGETYQAKKITAAFLENHPQDAEATQLMGQILETEISQHKEAFESKTPEEWSDEERESQVKTLLERGKSLLEIGAYEEAAFTVENIFQYEPQNAEASALMDTIQNRAMKDGKRQISDQSEIVQSEVEGRVSLYKRQAKTWIAEGKWGAARLAVEKILMLRPEDGEALKLLEDVKSERRG